MVQLKLDFGAMLRMAPMNVAASASESTYTQCSTGELQRQRTRLPR